MGRGWQVWGIGLALTKGQLGGREGESHWFLGCQVGLPMWALSATELTLLPHGHTVHLYWASKWSSNCFFFHWVLRIHSAQYSPFIKLLDVWNSITVWWNRRLRLPHMGKGVCHLSEVRDLRWREKQTSFGIFTFPPTLFPFFPPTPAFHSSIMCSSLDLVHLETRLKTSPLLESLSFCWSLYLLIFSPWIQDHCKFFLGR